MFGWLKKSERGTLTLLPDGAVILGLAPGFHPTQQEVEMWKTIVVMWANNQGVLALPFPVDVDDRRYPERPKSLAEIFKPPPINEDI
jgi:hypothetical protein